jgi:hypothetical protein
MNHQVLVSSLKKARQNLADHYGSVNLDNVNIIKGEGYSHPNPTMNNTKLSIFDQTNPPGGFNTKSLIGTSREKEVSPIVTHDKFN